MGLNIRPVAKQDYNTVKYIMSMLDSNMAVSNALYCDYYITYEPDLCFVAVDEFNKPCGCILGSKDFDLYNKQYPPFLQNLKESSLKKFIEYKHINKKVAEINKDFPAHLFVCVLPSFRDKGIGKELIKQMIAILKQNHISGINVIIDNSQNDQTGFFERIGFEKNLKLSSNKYVYTFNI